MQSKLIFIILILVISNNFVFGKNANKTKLVKTHTKQSIIHKDDNVKTRLKRSSSDDIDKTFISSKTQYDHNLEGRGKIKLQAAEKDNPFWGTRGRRESASDESVPDVQLPTYKHYKNGGKIKSLHKLLLNLDEKQRRDDLDSPFWGNRGRRSSEESDENDIDIFWGNRGRRQDEEPFWGTRGRREEDSPFWGNRGRRDDDDPFWGNRGRRHESEPFWGNRGRRKIFSSNAPSRGKEKSDCRDSNKEMVQPLWGNRAKLKQIKQSIMEAIENIQDNVDNLAVNKRDDDQSYFWLNRGRESKLKYLFNGSIRNRVQYIPASINKAKNNEFKPVDPSTVHDDRIYADEPRYILVERSSRSSAEDDPFFITRGKKYSDFELSQGVRGRRGAIEEILKSVRNDPYSIARGKKDANTKVENSSLKQDQFMKTKELVCSTVDYMVSKEQLNKVKRDNNDSERDRRTILNKLARQLQMDPYIVSRGKKNVDSNGKADSLEQFISNIISLCN